MNEYRHVLPGEQGETEWFNRQNKFEQEEILRQVKFKRDNYPNLSDGRNAGSPRHSYAHIFPAGCDMLSVHQSIALDLFSYLSREDIEIHSGIRNLKSSYAACLNILFPMREDLNLALVAFGKYLPNVKSVDNIEFEYTGPASITEWLGEPTKGKRGKNRTSIDAALFWTDKSGSSHISLIEWKYTERSFGTCSVYADKEKKVACDRIDLSSRENPALICPLSVVRDGNSRRFWEHMKSSGVLLNALRPVLGCPFRTPFYQLMRQYLVSAYLVQTKVADYAEVILLSFGKNESILDIPPELQKLVKGEEDNIISIWNKILKKGAPPVRHITVEQIMNRVDATGTPDKNWRAYIRDRYAV